VNRAPSVVYSPAYGRKENNARIACKLISESSASADKKFAALAEDISDIKSTMATKADITRLDTKIDSVESNLSGQINRIDTKLTKFEETEIDKRLQLEVRVTTIEKHLSPDKKIAA
jgi:hypothetical protein